MKYENPRRVLRRGFGTQTSVQALKMPWAVAFSRA